MATQLALSGSTYYVAGEVIQNGIVGWESSRTRVFRVSFTAPVAGARRLSFQFGKHYLGEGSASAPLRFYIGESDTSHANAGSTAEYHGTVAMTQQSDGSYISSGEADILLLPNKTYYLWIFPGSTTYGWFYWVRDINMAEVEGSAGVVRIREGGRELLTIPMVKEGGSLITLSATVKIGSELKYCV